MEFFGVAVVGLIGILTFPVYLAMKSNLQNYDQNKEHRRIEEAKRILQKAKRREQESKRGTLQESERREQDAKLARLYIERKFLEAKREQQEAERRRLKAKRWQQEAKRRRLEANRREQESKRGTLQESERSEQEAELPRLETERSFWETKRREPEAERARQETDRAFLEATRRRKEIERRRRQEPESGRPLRIRAKKADYWEKLDPYEFEQRIADLYIAAGYDARVTQGSGDGGVDINLKKNALNGAVQCKRHKNPTGPKTVRELYGVMVSEGYKFGAVVCTGGFTDGAIGFAEGKKIDLIGMDGILAMAGTGR